MTEFPTPRILLPSLLAGPLVLILLGVTTYTSAIPHPMQVDWGMALQSILLLPLSAIIGFLPALAANGIGTVVMIGLGGLSPLLRFPFIWPVVGGLAAWAVTDYWQFPADWVFAFTGSGAVSAMICRMRLA